MIQKIVCDGTQEFAFLRELAQRTGETDRKVTQIVTEIIDTVREGGDEAVKAYTKKFDGSLPQYYEVPREVIQEALTTADEAFVNALLNAQENIVRFHERQKPQGFTDARPDGVILGQRVRGLARVGLYVPGGTAAYPSSVLMNAIPAKIAGVGEIIMVTPPCKDGTPNKDILVAAWTGSSSPAVRRRSQHLPMERRRSRKWTRSSVPATSMLPRQRSCSTVWWTST